ncbi:hypothetical protein [Muricauda sp. MAR_2010_75]|uniref:hypothetical protein n=1 Tax=Allomuricauda sp. MAR_2010_75 TaxID=1250232 RepID=UPI0005649ED6|nr:hypothetical protein [Muricauda sp. MAR_2010_75]
MNKTDFESMKEIKQELKILRLKKDINLEALKSNKNAIEHFFEPLTVANRILSPIKGFLFAYILKRLFR